MTIVVGMLTYLGVADAVDDRSHVRLEDSQEGTTAAAKSEFGKFEENRF